MDDYLRENILDEISNYCDKSVKNVTEVHSNKPYIWTFYHSFFFSFTVCSTVGKVYYIDFVLKTQEFALKLIKVLN